VEVMETATTQRGAERSGIGRHRRRPGRHAAAPGPVLTVTRLRDVAVVLVTAVTIAGVTGVAFPRATSSASIRHDDTPDPALVRSIEAAQGSQLCRIDWRRSTWHVKKLIRCAAAHVGISPEKALYVAWRESRFQPGAYNAAGAAAGVFQHLLRYWPERAVRYGFPRSSPYNARANIFVTMRMVRQHGWWPWGV
jgi:hypothetical protein